MPTILHTGQGVYQPVQGSSYDPIQEVKEAGRVQADLMKYDYAIRKEREKQFLELVDIKTENMLIDTLQKEASNQINAFTEKAIDVYKKSKENPTLADQMALQKEKRKVEQWQADRLSEAQKYKKTLDLVAKDGGVTFDMDESIASLNEFAKDPLNKNVSMPTMRYQYIDEIWHDAYKMYPMKIESEYKEISDEAGNYRTDIVRSRRGLENDSVRLNTAMDLFDNNYQLQRSMNKEFDKLKSENPTEAKKYKDSRSWYQTTYASRFGLPETIEKGQEGKIKTTSKGSTFNFGSNSGGGYAFALDTEYSGGRALKVNRTAAGSAGGMPIKLQGRILNAGGKEFENPTDQPIEVMAITKDKIIGTMWKGTQEVDEAASQRLDQTKMNASMVGNIYYGIDKQPRKILKDKDGKYVVTYSLEPQEAYIDISNAKNRDNALEEMRVRFKFDGSLDQFKAHLEKIGGFRFGSTEAPKKTVTKLPDL